jgi:hypothetical protein
MQNQSIWMRFFLLLAALALVVVAAPIDGAYRAVARQASPSATAAAASASASTGASNDDDGFDFDTLFRRNLLIERGLAVEDLEERAGLGGLAKLGEDGAKLLGKTGSKSSATSAVDKTPATGELSKIASGAESALGKGKAPAAPPAAKPATPPPAAKPVTPPPAAKPATPPSAAKPAAPPPPKAKAAAGKAKNKLPSAVPSNGKINKLKDQDVLFFSGTGGKQGTADAKAFAQKNNLKTIDDAFAPGTFTNFNQFGGTDAEKTQFLKDASANFAKAIKPGKGKVFATFPGDAPPPGGIFNTIEAPALKANGHTALTKLDFNNLKNIADPHSVTDTFNL